MRLIDSDRLKSRMLEHYSYSWQLQEEIKDFFDNTPSVNQWIPVSERLPEEDDYRPCYGHDDGVVWWANDMGIIGLGWYYNSTGQWAYYDEITHSEQSVGKVLAWMPLPDPWKGEEE